MEDNQSQPMQFAAPPAKKKIYKKWWFWVIIVVIAIPTIAKLGSSDKPSKETGGTTVAGESKTEAVDTRFKLNEAAIFPKLKITANEIKESQGNDYFKPAEGKTFIGVQFTVENLSDEDQYISSMLLFDSYVDGIKCDYSANANISISDGTLDGTLSSGKKMQGYYAVEVPTDWKELEIEVLSSWLSSSKAVFVFNNA